MHWEPTRQIVVLKFSKPCLFGLVMELAYVSDSKSEFCGFESHPGHQKLYGSLVKKSITPPCHGGGHGFESRRSRQPYLTER